MDARKIYAKISIDKTDITEDITPYLKSISYSEVLDGESDTADIELHDAGRLWVADWFPSRGDSCYIELVRENWNGDGSIESFPLGNFEIDEIKNSYPPNVASIKLNSLANSTNIRGVNKSRSWEEVTLSKIAGDIAADAGLTLFFDTAENPTIKRAEQKEQSGISFLLKLCKDRGLCLKVSDGKLIIFDAEKYESQSPVKSLTYGASEIKSFSATATISKIYSSAKVTYKHGKKGEKIEYEYKDANKSDGMTLEINEKVENQAEAEKLAKKKLREKNQEEIKVNLTVIGDFIYSAGLVIELVNHGFYSGNYIIERVNHKIGGGYECDLELRRCLNGY